MRIISATTHIALGQTLLMTTLLLAAFILGLVPDRLSARREGRAALAEAIAVDGSALVTRGDIRALEDTLGLITFFTGNEKEVRARAVPRGTTAQQAAGHVHSDIERGFIGAEVIPFDLLIREQSVHHAREDGRLRLEGKTYEVQDGDVIFFRFNV